MINFFYFFYKLSQPVVLFLTSTQNCVLTSIKKKDDTGEQTFDPIYYATKYLEAYLILFTHTKKKNLSTRTNMRFRLFNSETLIQCEKNTYFKYILTSLDLYESGWLSMDITKLSE